MSGGGVKAFGRVAVVVLAAGSVGCSGQDSARSAQSAPNVVMPSVVGLQLDVALSDIKDAGFTDDVEIIGGGMLGVVVESNWQVCEQSPGAGATVVDKPALTVERSCDAAAPDTQPPDSTTAATATTTAATATTPVEAEHLTVENSADLAALLAEPDYCADRIAAFASTYRGRIIEFDGNIAAMNRHGDSETRFDILLYAGDYSETVAIGPAIQFRDVNYQDLHLTGPNAPDSVGQGINLHITAEVGEYEAGSCLFLLNPVSTEVR